MNLTSESSSIGIQGIATLDAFLFVVDSGNHRIQKFDMDGTFLLEFGGYGDTDGFFKNPWGVASDGTYVYVTDTYNYRVQVFDLDGNWQYTFGEEGTSGGDFSQPRGIVEKNGYLYIADTNNNRIQIFTRDGRFVMAFGSLGSEEGEYDHPVALAISGNSLYIDDRGNGRVVILELKYVDPNYVPPPIVLPRNIKTTYICKLGGLAGIEDATLPMKNMSARLSQGTVSLSINVPLSTDIEAKITARPKGTLAIYQLFHKDDGTVETRFMFQARMVATRVYEGALNGTITLTGRSKQTFSYFATVAVESAMFRTAQDASTRYRIEPLAWVWPENKLVIDATTIDVEKVTLTLSPTSGTMEVTKKL